MVFLGAATVMAVAAGWKRGGRRPSRGGSSYYNNSHILKFKDNRGKDKRIKDKKIHLCNCVGRRIHSYFDSSNNELFPRTYFFNSSSVACQITIFKTSCIKHN